MFKRYLALTSIIISSYGYAPLASGLAAQAGVTADISSTYLAVLNTLGVLAQPTVGHVHKSRAHVPLFTQFPQLADTVAHVALGSLPTPVNASPVLSEY